MSFLEIAGLSAGYGKAVIVRNLDLEVGDDETVAIVGRNGAGKTTLMMSLFGMTTVVSGEIRVDGQRLDPTVGFRAASRGVAIAPQGKHIFPHLTVKENLLLGAASRRKGYWNLRRAFDLFPILEERHNKLGTALSGGQQQMLAIGRALMANPRLLMLDEPTEGLAPAVIDNIVAALQTIRSQGTGLLVVEQHLSLVRRVSDRFVVMGKGEIRHQAVSSELDSDVSQRALAI